MNPVDLLLKKSRFMLELERDWDDCGAPPISQRCFNLVEKFLRSLPSGVRLPDVGPVPDGSVDLFWGGDSDLLVNIHQKSRASFYGDNDMMNIKGCFLVTDKIPADLLNWIITLK